MIPVRLHVDKPLQSGAVMGALGWVYRVEPDAASPVEAGGTAMETPTTTAMVTTKATATATSKAGAAASVAAVAVAAASGATRPSRRCLVRIAGPLPLPVGWDMRERGTPLALAAGEYLVRVRMPAGEEVVDGFLVPDGGQELLDIAIETSGSPHEALAHEHLLGAVPSDEALRAISAPRARGDLVREARASPIEGASADARGRLAAAVRADWQRHAQTSRARLAELKARDAVAWVVRSGLVEPDGSAGTPARQPRSDRGWLRYWLGGVAATQPVAAAVSDEAFVRVDLGPYEPGLLEPMPTSLREIFEEGTPAGAARSYFVVPDGSECTAVGVLPLPWPAIGDGPEAGVAVPVGLTLRWSQAARFSNEGDGREPSRLRATIAPADPAALPLLGYLGSGCLEAAPAMVDAAREALARGVRNPYAAAAMAYVILAATEALDAAEATHDGEAAPRAWARWIGALALHFPLVPDGMIARGWLRLQDASRLARTERGLGPGARQAIEAARGDLLAAVHRGIPYYAHGVRLLTDGLTMICGWDGPSARTPQAREARAARTASRWLSMRTDRREVFTTLLL